MLGRRAVPASKQAKERRATNDDQFPKRRRLPFTRFPFPFAPSPLPLPLCALPLSKDYPFVAGAARDVFAVEVFE